MRIDTTVMLAKICIVEIFGSVWSNQTHDDIERVDLSVGYFLCGIVLKHRHTPEIPPSMSL
jgi:hypothetical protein